LPSLTSDTLRQQKNAGTRAEVFALFAIAMTIVLASHMVSEAELPSGHRYRGD